MKIQFVVPAVAMLLLVSACDDHTEPLTPARAAEPWARSGSVQLEVPAEHPGNPLYALIFNGLTSESPHFLDAAMSDLVLTLQELLDLPSAMVGSADRFVATYVNGPPPDDRLLNKLSANGTLPDGREFRISANEREGGTRYRVKV